LKVGGQTISSADREPIIGVWGWNPQWGPGAEPLVRGAEGQSPPEAETLLAFGRSMEVANLPTYLKSSNTETRHLCYLANVAIVPSPPTSIHHLAICGLWNALASCAGVISI